MHSQKRVRLLILCLMIMLLIFNPFDTIFSEQVAVSMESFSHTDSGMEGEGTELNPYIITSVSQLRSITLEGNHDKHYRLGNDLDLSEFDAGDGSGWRPLGEISVGISSFAENNTPVTERTFGGTLDGAGHTLHNLFINNNQYLTSVGLFAELEGATIKNIHFKNVSINSNSFNTAVLAGVVYDSIIENITVTGNIEGEIFVGGLVGNIHDSNVENVLVEASILANSGSGIAGGLAILSVNSSFNDIEYLGEIHSNGEAVAGGIALAESTTITNIKIDADITSIYGMAGGVASILEGSSVENILIHANIESEWAAAGVVTQLDSSSIQHAYIEANIISENRAAGVASTANTEAWNEGVSLPSYITDVYSNSYIQGRSATGGIAGMTYETIISNIQVTGTVKDGSYLGGIVGRGDNTSVSNALSTVELEADERNTFYIGGIIGFPSDRNDTDQVDTIASIETYNSNEIINSYWLRMKPIDELEEYSNIAFSRTDNELKQMGTFQGWDFDNKWRIYDTEAYPFLLQFNPIQELIVSEKEIHMFEGEEYPIEVTVHYNHGQVFDVTDKSSYESNNSNILIDSNGVISTLDIEGDAVITVSYSGVQEHITVVVIAIPVAQQVHFVDTDLRENLFRGRLSWLPAVDEQYVSGYEIHLLNSNQQSLTKLGEVEQGGDYYLDITSGTTFPDGATFIAVIAKSDESLFDKYTSIFLEDTTWTNSFMYKHLLKNDLQQLESPFITPDAPISLSHLMQYIGEQPDVSGNGEYQQEDVQFLLELIEPEFIDVLTY